MTTKRASSACEANWRQSTRPRSTQRLAVGALGLAVVDSDKRLPTNDFFVPGQVFEVRAVLSNYPNAGDDRKLNLLNVGLKFADHEWDSPLDLVLQTGQYGQYVNGQCVLDDVTAMQQGQDSVNDMLLSTPLR
ncbi:hypothetical protein LSAT2_007210 [Lamellibrachia satsuma]|nr:hypothetical protein LSAT2_007210 [Lamellibrachia satsuma]